MTGYAHALARLYSLQSRGMRLGVEHVREALKLRGHPERGQAYVHVAGTNGKGSVSSMLAACLQRQGFRTGLYTSPHLHRWVERVRIQGRPIRDGEAERRIEAMLAWSDAHDALGLTFFELTTLIALEAFSERACDIAVLETGLGGRLDATNAIKPKVSVITNIALDHQQYLGDTIAAVAGEKAGIIKRGVPVVVGTRERDALRVIQRQASQVETRVLQIDRDFGWQPAAGGAFDVWVGRHWYRGLTLALAGAHQHDNAACVLATLSLLARRGFHVVDDAARDAMRRVRWPGRLEVIARRPTVLLDAAHNPDGAKALAAHVATLTAKVRARGGRTVLVFGVMSDKDWKRMLKILRPSADECVFVRPRLTRALDPKSMGGGGRVMRDVTSGLKAAIRLAGEAGLVVVAGSIFVIAEARVAMLLEPVDPPIRM